LLTLGASLAAFVGYAQYAFLASFFFRNYAADLAHLGGGRGPAAFIGTALGLILGVGGTLGTLLGGYFGDRLSKRSLRGYLTVALTSCLTVVPFFLCVVCVRSFWLALAFLIPASIMNTVWSGPVFAAIQGLVNERSRATAAAVAQLCFTLVGLGLGPLVIGALSDVLGARLGAAEGIRWALAMSTGMSLVSGAVFWLARRRIGEDNEPRTS
jgi:MFS family permease